MERILVIDDERDICTLLKKFLAKNGYEVAVAQDGQQGIKLFKKDPYDLVICDFQLPDNNGLEMLEKIKILNSTTAVIITANSSDVQTAVDTVKKGAFDYVTKPLYPDEILSTIKDALEERVTPSKKRKKKQKKRTFIIGSSPQSQLVQKHIDLIAPTNMSVIIIGETGTGKEYVARSIHEKSPRKSQPFVAVDCGALPKDLAGSELFGHVKGAFTGAIKNKKGCFELANGGTLFLDEIGNLTYENQTKLLRALQEQVIKRIGDERDIPVDVRVLVATNESLLGLIESDAFREDIYHRLNEFKIELSPLRERPDDIDQFAHHFLNAANQQLQKNILGFDEGAMRRLKAHYWYGNLRELRNVIKRSVLLCQQDYIDESCLPMEMRETKLDGKGGVKISFPGGAIQSLKSVAEAAEKKAILEALKRTNKNKTRTAKLLDIDRKTLYNKMKLYKINL